MEINSNNLNLIENLPNSLNELILEYNFNLPLNDLPNSIKFLKLPIKYNKSISNIPINLRTLLCDPDYKFIDNFSNYNIIKKN